MRFGALAALIATSGCSTVTQGTHQAIALSTPNVDGATCRVSRGDKLLATVSTPSVVRLARGKQQVEITCTTASGATLARTILSRYSPCSRFQAPLGYLVDGASGAMWRYPDKVEITATDTAPAKDDTKCRLAGGGAKTPAVGDLTSK